MTVTIKVEVEDANRLLKSLEKVMQDFTRLMAGCPDPVLHAEAMGGFKAEVFALAALHKHVHAAIHSEGEEKCQIILAK